MGTQHSRIDLSVHRARLRVSSPPTKTKHFWFQKMFAHNVDLFVLSFFPRDVLDEILNLIESVSEDFPSYSTEEVFVKGANFS